MKLTPLDLQQKTFRKVNFGGLEEREVRSFLEMAATQLEELTRKLNRQDEELRRREARINEFKDREQLLQQILQAEKIIANAQARRMQLVGEIEELKRARASFQQQLQALLDQHKSILDHMRGEPQPAEPPAADNVSFLAPPASKKK